MHSKQLQMLDTMEYLHLCCIMMNARYMLRRELKDFGLERINIFNMEGRGNFAIRIVGNRELFWGASQIEIDDALAKFANDTHLQLTHTPKLRRDFASERQVWFVDFMFNKWLCVDVDVSDAAARVMNDGQMPYAFADVEKQQPPSFHEEVRMIMRGLQKIHNHVYSS